MYNTISTQCYRNLVSCSRSQLYSTVGKPYREVSIPVPWGHVAGKWWGPIEQKPILCMHGMQDNCSTFDRLIPFLSKKRDVSFLAVDFPGHGYSSSYPEGMIYDVFGYVILIRRIFDYFKWSTISLMGHSLGAVTSFSFTLLYPKQVDFVVCIDALKLMEFPLAAEGIRKSIDRCGKYETGSYNRKDEEAFPYTLEEIKRKVISAHEKSLKPENAHFLYERNIAASKKYPGKYYFTRDPRLKSKIMFHWPSPQIAKDASHVTCPIYICKATGSSYFEPKENFYSVLNELQKSSKDCDFHMLDGTHYLHLNEPEIISTSINNFLDKHYVPEYYDFDSSISSELKSSS